MSERELIRAVLDGDAAAERRLYDAHVDRVYRLAYRMAGDDTLAEDFTQETFVRAFTHLPGFRGQSAFSTWLHSIAMSVVLNGLRKVKRVRRWEADPESSQERGRQDPDAVLRLGLRRAVDALDGDLRAVFLMHDVEGYKHREIAEILEVPEGTSKARLFRAREKLRGALGERGEPRAQKEGR